MKTRLGVVSRRALVRAAAVMPLATVRGTAANSAIALGVVGTGDRGVYVAHAMAETGKARVVALCDVFDARIESARKLIPAAGARSFKNYQDLLASGVDAVVFATPVHLHPEHFAAAVRSGKHIYFEKPAALDVAGCRAMLRAAEGARPGVNLVFGFQRRYGQMFLKARQAVESGAIGRIEMAHAHWFKGLPEIREWTSLPPRNTDEERIRQWRWWRDTFGDAIVETFCHGIDVLNWFLGAHPMKAHGTGGRTAIRFGDIRDHVNVTFDYPNNVQASLAGSFIAPTFYRAVHEQFFGPLGVIETSEGYWTRQRRDEPTLVEKSPRDISMDAAEAFVDRVLHGRPENTIARGVESTLTAIMARMAIDLRREVTWDEMLKA